MSAMEKFHLVEILVFPNVDHIRKRTVINVSVLPPLNLMVTSVGALQALICSVMVRVALVRAVVMRLQLIMFVRARMDSQLLITLHHVCVIKNFP